MYAISLTTIPPRFPTLPRVLAALTAQTAAPATVFLTIPRHWSRFDPAPLPAIPFGVTLIETDTDLGPVGKLLPAAARFDGDILICDDDWLYAPEWAATFLTARAQAPDVPLAASTWDARRIGYPGTVLQGFAGALIPARMARAIPPPPEAARPADDVWISAHLTGLTPVPEARGKMTPLADPGALQSRPDRDAANRAAARLSGRWSAL
ncbi:hypothetical protein [Maritimibacter sp. UBA3975]|uniref:hypothetical protein n=1 Tax=Maritimibacter sp. UBA3975 TaxID=1946833 RepID=UPI000C0BAABC|nr:hypothetical protein [Maritimibacter sp. UBA3975]MAM63051.1 hypothetical protein [Maritimibacter sp.]|tara:strand:- start:16059 stop:16685 length:627 start_codon:yes stop_codon:yes gene_type:complete